MTKLAKASYSFVKTWNGATDWAPEEIDKLEIFDLDKFESIVQDCRFYYRRDPIASTVINKMVEIGVTNIVFDKGTLSDNEFRIFTGLEDKLRSFIEDCALEYLISGLVVPEINYISATKDQLMDLGIKKYPSLTIPGDMWIRDPTTIKIKDSMVLNDPSYYVVLPDELVYFIQNKGMYPDGNKDIPLYEKLLRNYPEFVEQVLSGNKEVLLDNKLIIRRKVVTGSPYPTPYLYPALEALKHKRNIRRMDYSIASRVIEAIQLIQLGNDEYPVVEGEEDVFDDIRQQMSWRNSAGKSMERIFQLFANHTLQVSWVYPDVETLLNEEKYAEVNQDIFFGLGFPRILTTGETAKTQTSNAEFATLSPQKSMENMQTQLLKIIKGIIKDISVYNRFKDIPTVRFDKINLHSMNDFVNTMNALLSSKAISYTTYSKAFGYSFDDESKQRTEDAKIVASINEIENPIQEENMGNNKEESPKKEETKKKETKKD